MGDGAGFSLKDIARVFDPPLHYAKKQASSLSDTFNDIARETFPNGLHADFRPTDTGLIRMQVKVNSGSLQDPPGKAGLAHIVEHMVFMRPDVRELRREFEQRGGIVSALTSEQSTDFTFTIPKGRENEQLLYELSGKLLLDHKFDAAELKEEKNVVVNEIHQLADGSAGEVSFAALKLAYGENFHNRVSGTPESVGNISAADLAEFSRRHYVPANMEMSVTGANFKSAYVGVRNNFAPHEWVAPPAPVAPTPVYNGGYTHVDDGAKINQTQVFAAFPLSSASAVNEGVLRNYLHTAVNDRLRGEKDRVSYGARVEFEESNGQRIITFKAASQPETAGVLLPAISDTLSDLAAGRVDQRRFEAAMALAQRGLTEYTDGEKRNPDSTTNSMNRWLFYRDRSRALAQVTPAALSAIVRDSMMTRPPTLATRGDIKNVQSYGAFTAMLPLQQGALENQAAAPVLTVT